MSKIFDNDNWSSVIVSNFFSEYANSCTTDLVDFFAYYLDILQQENFENELLNPIWTINNLPQLLDIDSEAYRPFYNGFIPEELESIIEKTITWTNFVKISKKIFSSKGTLENIKFWLSLVSESTIDNFYFTSPEDISTLQTLGIRSEVYQNTTDSFLKTFDTNDPKNARIPNILKIEDITIKENFSIRDLEKMLRYITPKGVIFLIYSILTDQSIVINLNIQQSRALLYQDRFKIYPDYRDIYDTENDYTLNNYKLYEIRHLPLLGWEEDERNANAGYSPEFAFGGDTSNPIIFDYSTEDYDFTDFEYDRDYVFGGFDFGEE